MAQTDAAVARVLGALEEKGFAGDTLVIFSSDNGPEFYAYERVRRYGHRSMGPLRGLKRHLWEGGHRVPFLVRWPGVVEAGRVSGALTGQIDIMATVAEAVGYALKAGEGEDGISQLGVWRGGAEAPRKTLVYNTSKGRYALREKGWVYLGGRNGGVPIPGWFDETDRSEATQMEEALYDLDADLGQRVNLVEKETARAEAMRTRLREIVGGAIDPAGKR
jgi:arylsulfatase A